MPLGNHCDHIVAIVNFSNTAQSFVVTTYPAPLIVFASHCHLAHYMSYLVQCP